MTPQRVADISESVEVLYEEMTDELLLNIAKHLNSPTTTWTALREIELLARMGQLTEENTKIINKYVQKIPQAVKYAMNESRKEALSEIEDKLAQAALNGYLVEPVTDSTVGVAKAFAEQALGTYNMVNQTMLQSSLEAYRQGITEIQTIANERNLFEAEHILSLAADQVALGTETRTGAVRKAIENLNARGITGFYDRIGRSWSAEAYVNMTTRTTVHNTYIQSVKSRQEDYGSDVFQVSAHAGARPLCYPYQGKFYSWSHGGGYITLGDGRRYRFESINTTSYGKPAGLFGINCGHVPYPMIPSVSEPVDEKIPPKAENDKEYQESQQQRALERKIRNQKREIEMLGSLATKEDKAKLRQYQEQMRAFIADTGRVRRYDREKVVTGKQDSTYTIRDYSKASKQLARTMDAAISDAKEYGAVVRAVKPTQTNSRIPASLNSLTQELEYNPKYFGTASKMEQTVKDNVGSRQWAQIDPKDYDKYIAVHESSHAILDILSNIPENGTATSTKQEVAMAIDNLFEQYKIEVSQKKQDRDNKLNIAFTTRNDGDVRAFMAADEEYQKTFISNYASDNVNDFMAEARTEAILGTNPSEYSKLVASEIEKLRR